MAGCDTTIAPPLTVRPEKLHHLSRAFGFLEDIRSEDEDCIVAKIGRREIVLPAAIEPDLRPLIGCRIGMVRIENKYLVRRAADA